MPIERNPKERKSAIQYVCENCNSYIEETEEPKENCPICKKPLDRNNFTIAD